jgi:hypothetical protein
MAGREEAKKRPTIQVRDMPETEEEWLRVPVLPVFECPGSCHRHMAGHQNAAKLAASLEAKWPVLAASTWPVWPVALAAAVAAFWLVTKQSN